MTEPLWDDWPRNPEPDQRCTHILVAADDSFDPRYPGQRCILAPHPADIRHDRRRQFDPPSRAEGEAILTRHLNRKLQG